MNKILAILAALFIAVLPVAARTPGEKVGVVFADTRHDFGNSAENADNGIVVHEYTFTNNSTQPVAIVTVTASCGCTKPEYTKKPVAPGQEGKVTVKFNKRGQRGEVNKDIKVRFRSADGKSDKVTLRLSGVVIPD